MWMPQRRPCLLASKHTRPLVVSLPPVISVAPLSFTRHLTNGRLLYVFTRLCSQRVAFSRTHSSNHAITHTHTCTHIYTQGSAQVQLMGYFTFEKSFMSGVFGLLGWKLCLMDRTFTLLSCTKRANDKWWLGKGKKKKEKKFWNDLIWQ